MGGPQKKIPTYWVQQKKESDLSRPTKKRYFCAVQQKNIHTYQVQQKKGSDLSILEISATKKRYLHIKYNKTSKAGLIKTYKKKTFLYSTTKKRYPHIKYNKRKNQTYQGYKML